MGVAGRKPKPRDQIRHRNTPVHEWTEVADRPFDDAPPLPRKPMRPKPLKAPQPERPLGAAGQALWDRTWRISTTPPDRDLLLQLCEQTDERQGLRARVFRAAANAEPDWRDRNSLRLLDDQITKGLVRLADRQDDRRPTSWPAATKRWWAAVSRLPHCALWTEGDWQFAMDTACLVAEFHAGNFGLAQEIRRREAIMGTTADARRDLRIRYVEHVDVDPSSSPSVTAMAEYRRSVTS